MEEEKKDNLDNAGEGSAVIESTVFSSENSAKESDGSSGESGDVFGQKKKTKPLNKKFIGILILIVLLVVGYSAYEGGKFDQLLGKNPTVGMTTAEAEDFINTNLVQEGTKATVAAVVEESGLYKITGEVQGQEFTIYITKDKNIFFPQAITLAEIQKQKTAEAEAAQPTKSDKPSVQLFVMSHCPYGTQIEKGIIPVLETLGDKIDFKLEFCDYAMHGDKELKEELNQYCIMQNQPDKLISYLKCFLADENSSDKCVAQVGIDANTLKSCVESTDAQNKITANAADKNTWKNGSYPVFPLFQADVEKYQISGSPTLVINGKEIKSNRDSAGLLSTICSAFNTAPEECSKSLSSTAPSAGFGYSEGSDSNSSASCGS